MGHHKKEAETKNAKSHPPKPHDDSHGKKPVSFIPQPHGKHGADNNGEPKKENPNLTKRDLKLIEKLHAKIEYLEIRDEYDEADKLREQIIKVEDNANGKATKKADKKDGVSVPKVKKEKKADVVLAS